MVCVHVREIRKEYRIKLSYYKPSSAFLTFSNTLAHCSIRGSLGAAKKNALLKVPRQRMCWKFLYSRPISRLMHSLRSIVLRGDFPESAIFLDL